MVDNEKVEELLFTLEDKLDKTVSVLREAFANIRAGRANPHILDKIQVDYYGQMTPGIPPCSKASKRRSSPPTSG
mgnify:CR=1 FL=1